MENALDLKVEQIEEYFFYKYQLQQAKLRGANSIAISTDFLDFILTELNAIEEEKHSLVLN